MLEGTRTAKLATARRDGRPQVVPVWFPLDGDDVALTTSSSSVKDRAIRRDGRVAEELSQQYGELNAGEGMMLVRVTPDHVVSEDNITG